MISLVCMERSGSYLLWQLITEYQKRKYGTKPLHTPEWLSYKDRQYTTWTNINRDEGEHRLIYYTSLEEKPVVKLIHKFTTKEVLDYCMQNSKLVCIDRMSLLDQFLSHVLAVRNKNFHVFDDGFEYQPIEVYETEVLEWWKDRKNFNSFKMMHCTHCIYYEDYVDNYDYAYENLGLFDYKEYITNYDFIKSRKVFSKPKTEFIKNMDEVMVMFKKYSNGECYG